MSFSIVFPGQGSQSVGMLASLADAYPVVKDTFAQASDVLGYDVFKLTQEGPVEELNQTSRTQPALLTASYAIWQVWKSLNGKDPEFMAGHSLGEYSALTCAGAIEFKDAVKLVEQRGIFMQESVRRRGCKGLQGSRGGSGLFSGELQFPGSGCYCRK